LIEIIRSFVPEVDEAHIVKYLLGELPDEDRTRLEERFMREVEYRELIRSIEDDLIDDYVRGELTPHQRALFEKQFTALPHRARKVETAKALSRALGDGRSRARLSVFSYPLAAAAVLVLALGVWLVMGTRRSQPEVQLPPTAQGTTPPEAKPSAPDVPPTPAPLPSIATFLLPPGLVRDSAAAKTFVIPQGTQLVRLRLPLDKGDEYPAYRAELRTSSGNSVLKADAVRPQADASGLTVVLDVAANLLPVDKYELALAGVNKGVTEDIGFYYFSIVNK
jgi:hypothetical protein